MVFSVQGRGLSGWPFAGKEPDAGHDVRCDGSCRGRWHDL
ncbi:hypothetical protein NBRC3293_1164 [Gluconobacter oxydans NBRC 3293]|uniref:Uncharacterized protein n=1 Tax=Gluconobacter oxydans NBRC 3293 TaxID=1315969 RepID=A0A829X1D0_GLUOY|nr:hypothetical protein NBRC3293_1164 [Gluconobacter oxydans NBRC 3293]